MAKKLPPKSEQIMFTVDLDEKARLEERAEALQLSLAELCRRAIRCGLPIIDAATYPGIQK